MTDDRIPEILQRVDLVALAVRLGAVEAKQSGGTTTLHCPHPAHPDHSASFTVKGGRWTCWSGCARNGDAIDLVVWLTGCSIAEAIEQLAAEVGLERRSAVTPRPAAPSLVTWCAGRGWGPWVIDALGLTLVKDAYGHARARFPFRMRGEVAYFQDRALDDGAKFRWLSPKGGKPLPYEVERLQLAHERGHVVLVEGVTDVAALVDVYTEPAVVGIPGAKAWRPQWAEAFRGLVVVVLGDNDPAGETFRATVTADLQIVAEVQHGFVPPAYNDLAAWRCGLGAEEFDAQLMAALGEVAPPGLLVAG